MRSTCTLFVNEYQGDTKASFDFIEYVKNRQQNTQEDPVYSLSDQALFQANNLVEGLLDSSKVEAKRILAEKKKKQKQIGELDSYLSLDINEKELQEVYKKIKKAEEKLIKDQVKMSSLEQKRTAANSKVMATTSEFNKYVEAYLATAESRDSAERTIKYSNIALSILDRYQVELQKRKTDILAETITSCYKKLANKKNLINKIVMESDSLAIKYLSEEGKEVTQDSLSAGEQQLMVISILWALAICSKKKLPVIIDTPLSRLDSLHRTALINTYFPNAGEQTIILSTDSEIDSTYFVEKEGKDYIDRKNYSRFIAYLNAFTKVNHEFFYDITDAENPLKRKIRLNEKWVNFILQNYAVIMGWLRFNKALFIQDRNPGVPGVMYKVAPETEEKRKSLKNARELWIATVDVTGRPLYEIYTGNELSIDEFDLDHFVPRSYVSNDELWNLTPMAKKLNSSKNNKLPERRYIKDFVEYNYYLYSLIFANGNKDQAAILKQYFDRCENQHLNAIWAIEKLYIPGNTKEQFGNILEENLSLVYDSAKLQEYEEWVL